MGKWSAALLASALAVVVAALLPIYPFEPIVVTALLAVFLAVACGAAFALLRLSFATGRLAQGVAAAVLAVAWILAVSAGAAAVQELYAPVHDDRCIASDPRDPDCASPARGT